MSTRNVNPQNFSYFRPYMLPCYRLLAAEPRVTIINNSAAGAADYEKWIGNGARLRVIRNGVDTVSMRRADAAAVREFRMTLGVPEDALLVGSIFRLNAEKRPLLWLQTAARVARSHPKARFVLFGGGPMANAVAAEARRLGLGGRLVVERPTNEVALALSAMDVF